MFMYNLMDGPMVLVGVVMCQCWLIIDCMVGKSGWKGLEDDIYLENFMISPKVLECVMVE
jgi:hypothetical protein